METIEIQIDDSCKLCKEGLKYFRKLHKQNKKAYMNVEIHPTPKSDEDLMKRIIWGLILTPDYNSAGHLTHFHIRKEHE